ncbi:ABC transporter ATP-binding protein/permease [Shinella sp.]|uniref:ABC transporter ATP-binding protein/permease n=1 Tax=Shinella sp. TaxID=1870904 RepID=UPI0029B77EE7|nr:ABC transporter ATP-binding protein/permease [Shinella sp.]MDX3978741.1 ABC transporter ATP-binding protein/permease [Shinella sp.]
MADPKPMRDGVEEPRLRQYVATMAAAFNGSPLRGILVLLAVGVLVVILATAYGQIVLNRWNQPFYDALQQRNMPVFLAQLLVFFEIAGALLVLNVAQLWLNQMLHLKLREALTRDMIDEWLRPGRAFRVARRGQIGINPDQRLHEDARHLSDLSVDLGVGLLQAGILLISFVGVLWALSSGFVFHLWGAAFQIPGYMVWAAILYSGTASWLSWMVGRPLIALNGDRYAREADLRYSLMRVNEQLDAISVSSGEVDEARRLQRDLAAVMAATRRIVFAMTRLAWVTSGYGWVTIVAPIIIAAPVYFGGDMTFGGLMMAVGAFNQFHASLRWFVDNIGSIADWRATLGRVAAFRLALMDAETADGTAARIAFVPSPEPVMVFDDLEIDVPSGPVRLSEPHVEVHPGDRVLVTGAMGAGKTLLTQTIAGLWLWGRGSISLPRDGGIAFVVRDPYLPPGTLRAALCYPRDADAYSTEDILGGLQRAGLERLAPSLDRVDRWEREFGNDERRMLSIVQLLLHRPGWIVIDDIGDLTDGDNGEQVVSIFREDLASAAIVAMGTGEGRVDLFARTLRLVPGTGGR